MAEYKFCCEPCDAEFLVEGSMDAPPQPEDYRCPDCKGEVYRDFSSGAVVFKGGGWETNIGRIEKLLKNGLDKQSQNKWADEALRTSAANNKIPAFKPMYMDPERAMADGVLKKSKKDPIKRAETARKIAGTFRDQNKK